MKSKKIVYIDTGMFSIAIYWNGKLIGLHLGVLLGLIALNLATREHKVHNLCLVVLLIELLILLVTLMRGFHVSVEDAPKEESTAEKSEPVEKSTLDVEVTSKKAANSDKPVKKTSKEEVINNKVPIPNASQSLVAEAPKAATTTEDTTNNDVDAKVEEFVNKFTGNSMSEEDWEELFNM